MDDADIRPARSPCWRWLFVGVAIGFALGTIYGGVIA